MIHNEKNLTLIQQAEQQTFAKTHALQILQSIDLTRLNDNDNEDSIIKLCELAPSGYGNVAAICVYPQFVSIAHSQLKGSPIEIASVSNFPEGNESLDVITTEIDIALSAGADEIDLVLPSYTDFAQNRSESLNIINQCKKQCGEKILKVILESGIWTDSISLFNASIEVIEAGADFIKTSTGKRQPGATLDAAIVMLNAIKTMRQQGYDPGFKASGGVRTLQQANAYLYLAKEILGQDWINTKHFRIGASGLLDSIVDYFRRDI